jgi:hypothetical protein
MAVRTVDLQHAISISVVRASGPLKAGVRTVEAKSAISISDAPASRRWQTGVRAVVFELRFLPYVRVCQDGNPRRPDSCINHPITEHRKNLKLGRILRGVLTGC